jgi:hypothetical protein
MLFSLAAAYTHYYGLIAAFWANILSLFPYILRRIKTGELICICAYYCTTISSMVVHFIQHTKKAGIFLGTCPYWRDFLPASFFLSLRNSGFRYFLAVDNYCLRFNMLVIYRNYVVKKESTV